MKIKPWGQHLILTARKCMPIPIRCKKTIESFSSTLVRNIDMVPFGPPQVVLFGEGDKRGYTLVQLIETSNIISHFCEETNDMHLDVFSCKEYNPDTVDYIVREFFNPEEITKYVIMR